MEDHKAKLDAYEAKLEEYEAGLKEYKEAGRIEEAHHCEGISQQKEALLQ